MSNPINLYLHCRKCFEMGEPPNIEAGITHGDVPDIVVWCKNHDIQVSRFQLKDPPQNLKCECCNVRPDRPN